MTKEKDNENRKIKHGFFWGRGAQMEGRGG